MVAPAGELQALIAEVARLAAHVFERQIGPLAGEQRDGTGHEMLLCVGRRVEATRALFATAVDSAWPPTPIAPQCYTCGMRLRLSANLMLALALTAAAQAAPPIELELATERGVQITAPHEWLQLFASLGIENVRIRGAKPGDEPRLDNRGTRRAAPLSRASASSRPANELRLPGGTFRRRRPREAQRLLRSARGRRRRIADRPARPLRPDREGIRRRACRSCPTDRF